LTFGKDARGCLGILTLKTYRPTLTPEDKRRLEQAPRDDSASE